MLNFQELEIFIAAAEQGSFSEAGRMLHLSQPAVSQAIQNLERRLSVQLFARVGRSVRLTEAGDLLLPMARELRVNAMRIEETMAGLHGSVFGRLSIGCSTTSGKYILPHLIARFRKAYPQVRVDVLIHSRSTVLDRLADGQINFGVSSKQVEHHALEYLPFLVDDVILVAPADHPWARSPYVHADDLLDAPLIMREEGSGTAEVVVQGLLDKGISPDMMNIVMVLGNTEAIAMSVEAGIGLAFVSRLAAAHGLALGRLVEVGVEGLALRRDLYFVRNRNYPATRSQSVFWDFIRESVDEMAEQVGT